MSWRLWPIALLVASGGCQKTSAVTEQRTEPTPAVSAALAPALLARGDPVPQVSAAAHNGEWVTLSELGGRPLVVYFYPKDDTPGCTMEAQEIRDLWSQIQGTSALVIGVSTDAAESHRAFAEKHGLPFLLFSDSDHAIARAFGVTLRGGRAARVTFVFGRNGRLARVFPEVKPRGHAAQILAALQASGS